MLKGWAVGPSSCVGFVHCSVDLSPCSPARFRKSRANLAHSALCERMPLEAAVSKLSTNHVNQIWGSSCSFSRSCQPSLTKVWRLKNVDSLLKLWFSSLKCTVFYWDMKPAYAWPQDCSLCAPLPASGEEDPEASHPPKPVILGCADRWLLAWNKGSHFSWFSLQITPHSQNHIRCHLHTWAPDGTRLSGRNDPQPERWGQTTL